MTTEALSQGREIPEAREQVVYVNRYKKDGKIFLETAGDRDERLARIRGDSLALTTAQKNSLPVTPSPLANPFNR